MPPTGPNEQTRLRYHIAQILARMSDKVVGPLRNRMYVYYRFYFLNDGGQNDN